MIWVTHSPHNSRGSRLESNPCRVKPGRLVHWLSAGVGVPHEAGRSQYVHGLLWVVDLGGWRFPGWLVPFPPIIRVSLWLSKLSGFTDWLTVSEVGKKKRLCFARYAGRGGPRCSACDPGNRSHNVHGTCILVIRPFAFVSGFNSPFPPGPCSSLWASMRPPACALGMSWGLGILPRLLSFVKWSCVCQVLEMCLSRKYTLYHPSGRS